MRRGLTVSLVAIAVIAYGWLILNLATGNSPQLGLDLQGGASVVLKPTTPVANDTLDETIGIIRNRVDALGVAEPEITRQGNAILVELPGVKDQQRALSIVGQTAELRFRPVLQVLPADENTPLGVNSTQVPLPSSTIAGATTVPGATTVAGATTAPAATTASAATTAPTTAVSPTTVQPNAGPGGARPLPAQAATTTPGGATSAPPTTASSGTAGASTTAAGATTSVVVIPTTILPTTKPENDDPTKEVILPEKDKSGKVVARYLLGPAPLTGKALESAQAVFQNTWVVRVTFKSGADGIDAFNALAAKCYKSADQATCPSGQVAIVLDGVVESAPVIQSPSFTRDQVQISGGSIDESGAKDLALVLRFGSLPVTLAPQAVQTVSASLGKDSLKAGVIAGAIGVILVIAFMIIYYRTLGLVVLAGLSVSGALLWSVVSFLSQQKGLALTLAGATGIIVSIGVTVDSYVVYFERLKDDVRAGRTLRTSAERGFADAWRTILSADMASFIGAALLYYLTVGSVRGFAFFLGLSTLLDMLVAYFFTRPLVILLSRSGRFTGGKVLGVLSGESIGRKEAKVPVGVNR